MHKAWGEVRVEHVDGASDEAALGAPLQIRAICTLGGLEPEDVEVQAVFGRTDADDRIFDRRTAPMEPFGSDGSRWAYRLTVPLDRSGPCGYTVRILPKHPGLTQSQKLGLQALPS